jgi:hypothetical protein
MPESPLTPRRRWIDAVLIGAGVAGVWLHWWLPGVALIVFGLVVPVLQRSGRRHRGLGDAARLVPAELAAAHRELVTAAARPGVQAPEVLAEAHETILEVVALLGGRDPRGGAQRRFVAARCSAMTATAAELRQWSDAWLAAKAEVDLVAFIQPVAEPEEREPAASWLVTAFTVALSPVFLLWDGACLLGRGVVAFADGVALRVRTAGGLVVRAVAGLSGLAARARHTWAQARTQVAQAVAEARHRFLATRARVRLRLLRARRPFGTG